MNYKQIQKGLLEYDQKEVTVFIDHCIVIENEEKDGKRKNWWYAQISEQHLINLYKKVYLGGVYIDGETVTLAFKSKKLTVNYDYQAYKNRVLFKYPETVFDMDNVHKGDSFSFSKKNGRVEYTHKLGDPFNKGKEIIGTYCIIKNSRGEFIEILTLEDIQKMRSVSKTQNVWDQWFDRMVLKSGIKRACKTHFNDITGQMDKIDNEDVDFDNLTPPKSVFDLIEEYKTVESLLEWASSKENLIYHNDKDFREAVSAKKLKLTQDQDPAKNQTNG